LSQYIGDFHPLAHVNGFFEFNFIALICRSNSAVFFAVYLFKTIKQMYKVFVNENVIILTNKIPFGSKINLFDLKKISLIDIVSNVKKHKKIFLFHKNSEKLILNFKKKIKVIFAGGGIVKNNLDETLFIYRRNKWDLPKGKIDKGETIDQTALREVKEETGIVDLKIVDFRTKTYHIFKKNNEYCLKETTWYNMVSNFDGEFIPELKEDITKVVWKNDKKIKKIKNTFPNIKLLLSI